MTWEQKLEAIKAFSGKADLCMRKPGDWYVSASMDVGGDGMLVGKYGNGCTPEEAVLDHWEIYSTLPYDRYASTGFGETKRRAQWNGYMWKEVSVDEALAMCR